MSDTPLTETEKAAIEAYEGEVTVCKPGGYEKTFTPPEFRRGQIYHPQEV